MEKSLPANFNIRNPGRPTLLFIYADWCPHCQRAKPALRDVSSMLGTIVPVYWVDSEKHPDLMKKWDVGGFPTILLAHKGEVWNFTGARTADAIASFVCHKFSSSERPSVCSRVM